MVTMDYTDPRWIKASSGFELDDIAGEIAGKTSADFDEDGRVDSWYLDGFKGKDLVSTADQYLANMDFEFPVAQGLFQNTIKFGGKMKIMQKGKNITQRVKFHPSMDPAIPGDETKNWKRFWSDFSDNLTDVGARFSNIDYSLGNVVDAEWVARQDVNAYATTDDWQVVTVYNNEMCDGYNSAENVYAGYFMTTQHFGTKLSMITGVRMERTVIDYTGTDFLEKLETLTTVKAGTQYNSYLPGVHFRFVPTNKVVLRAAYSKTISRPSYRDLVPYEKVNVKNKTFDLGNPEIKPSFSHNFDLLAEYYPGAIGIVSAGLYHKRIKDFRTVLNYETPWSEIVDMIPHPDDPSLVDNPNLNSWRKDYEAAVDKPFLTKKPVNAGDASLVGLELAYQRRLDFMPGVLKNLSLYANYTHNWLSNKDDKAQMSGTAEDIVNLSLAYESKRVSARLSYNHTSEFLTQTGISKEYNVYCDAVNYLDLNIDYHLKQDKIILTASANNLLNEVQRYYQWQNDYTHSNLSNGTRFQFGVIVNIF
jgi:TonB-dependent receptor